MIVPPELRWHIAYRIEHSELEAAYVDFLFREYGKNVRKILDVGCGIGRHHKFLRERGYDVWGIDINEELLEKAKKAHPGFEDHYIKMDMRNMTFDSEFDGIFCWFTTFGYFDDKGNKEVLEGFRRALRPGGIFLIEIPNCTGRIIYRGGLKGRWYFDTENFLELTSSEIYEKDGAWYEDFRSVFYKKEGTILRKVEEKVITVRLYTPEEMQELVKSAGLEFLDALSGFKKVGYDSPRMVIIGRRLFVD